jgi:hypothetical protein
MSVKTYDLITAQWAAQEGTLAYDDLGLMPLRVIILEAKGLLVANQSNAHFRLAITSGQAEAVAKVLAGLAKTIPSPEDQLKENNA